MPPSWVGEYLAIKFYHPLPCTLLCPVWIFRFGAGRVQFFRELFLHFAIQALDSRRIGLTVKVADVGVNVG